MLQVSATRGDGDSTRLCTPDGCAVGVVGGGVGDDGGGFLERLSWL